MRILFVCHGNINRSSAGEIILKQIKPDWEVQSAGVKEGAGGEKTTLKMRKALQEKGFPSEGIKSQALTETLLEWADLVFYMDSGNLKRLAKFDPKHSTKLHSLGELTGKRSIPDPHFSSGYEQHKLVVDMISEALQNFLEKGLPDKLQEDTVSIFGDTFLQGRIQEGDGNL
jgi:protein-tyrosine phosphatase